MSFCAEEMRKLADAQINNKQLKASFELQIRKIAEDGGYAACYDTAKLSSRERIGISTWLTDHGFRVILGRMEDPNSYILWGDKDMKYLDKIYKIIIE